MLALRIAIYVLVGVGFFVFALMLACFFRTFYSPRRKPLSPDEYPIPRGKRYEQHRGQIIEWIRGMRTMEHTDVSVISFDGLRLCGKYYEYEKGAPIEILFHGYRGTAERDMCGGVHRCFEVGRNALVVDQRACGSSEGRVITFGVKESRDCLVWVDHVIKNIDPRAKIIITGISMGAATVMTAASMGLPENVVGVIADCGYTSPEAIIKKVMRDMRLPADALYPIARLAARVFGGFDPSSASPISSMRRTSIPVIFFHGDEDAYVPCYMSKENFEACASEHKRLVITRGAGHALCFPTDKEAYLSELRDFFEPVL